MYPSGPPAAEEFIGTVDAWQLHQLRWPFLRVLVPDFVARRELERYVERVLASGAWGSVRVVPHPDAGVARPGPRGHLVDLYGRPAAARRAGGGA
jgi:hypothetical protein